MIFSIISRDISNSSLLNFNLKSTSKFFKKKPLTARALLQKFDKLNINIIKIDNIDNNNDNNDNNNNDNNNDSDEENDENNKVDGDKNIDDDYKNNDFKK